MRRPQWIPSRPELRGLALAAVLGAVSLLIARVVPPTPFLSEVLIALVVGALALNTPLRHVLGLSLPGPDREPDDYAPGLRFTGKWVLRLAIILMGFKVQPSFFHGGDVLLIVGVLVVALPSTFFVAHALGAAAKVRRPMVDLLAAGTMICGTSAVNAVAPVSRAHRDEQATAIAVVTVFSCAALVLFRPVAVALGLAPSPAGLWSGLAVNDLSSAIAVGTQMGGAGGVTAAAAKSARVLLLAPTLVALSLLRREAGPTGVKRTFGDVVPGFLLGYVAMALARVAADRMLGGSALLARLLAADRSLVDLCMVTVSAGMGLHLAVKRLLASSPRALLVGGGAWLWMAGTTLAMVVAVVRGVPALAALIGAAGLLIAWVAYRAASRQEVQDALLLARFRGGAPLSLGEARRLLDLGEQEGPLSGELLRQVITQLHPSIGELIPIRNSPLPHGEGCRWFTYWQGASGWALVAISRQPGAATPIHAHPHRLLGKSIEGTLEELRFRDTGPGEVELVHRGVLGHEELVEGEGLASLHVVRAVGARPAIDLQLRGPEVGQPGRLLVATPAQDVLALPVGARLRVVEGADPRPGQGGEGAAAGSVY